MGRHEDREKKKLRGVNKSRGKPEERSEMKLKGGESEDEGGFTVAIHEVSKDRAMMKRK